MARLLQQIVSPPQPCSYLPRDDAVMDTRIMVDVTAREFDHMLARGWRRFGPSYFRPVCAACRACESLRIPVDTFQPSRSQKRALRKCAHLRVEFGVPRVTPERVDLYRAWHAQREGARGWNPGDIDEEQYHLQFCFPHPCGREITYFDGDRLVALGIVDETPTAFSSVYFFFHPDVARLSVGVASVLHEIRIARERGRRWLYLGFRVRDCASLRYKGDYQPHELLVGRPALDEEPSWVPAADAPATGPVPDEDG